MESSSRRKSAKRSFVGLDMGANAIRVIQGTHNGTEFTITGFSEALLPPGTVIYGRITDRAQVTVALKKLWRTGEFSTRNVLFAISDLNLGLEDAYITASEALIDARLRPIGAQSQSQALITASRLDTDHDELTLIIQIGSDDLTLVSYLGDQELFALTQPALGTDLVALALTRGLGVDQLEASRILFDEGCIPDSESPQAVLIKSWESTLLDAIHDGAQRIAAKNLDVTRVVLTGSGSRIPLLKEAISARLQRPVELLGSQPSFAVATGLAAMFDHWNDLLPAPVHEAVTLLRIRKWIRFAFIALGVSSLAYWGYQQQQLNHVWQQVEVLRVGSQ